MYLKRKRLRVNKKNRIKEKTEMVNLLTENAWVSYSEITTMN